MGLLEDLRLPMMSLSSAIRARPEREETRNGEKDDSEFADVKLWTRTRQPRAVPGNKAPVRDVWFGLLSYQ
jgi:hypothetical protein